MATCCVAFGSDDSYFFNSPSKWSWNGIHDGLLTIFQSEPKAKEVHEIALGPNGSYAVIYTNQKGVFIRRNNLPAALEKWLIPVAGKGVAAARDLRTMQIALGPSGNYFAFDKNGASWGGGLPAGLQKAIAEGRDAKGNFKSGSFPQSVSLGADGTYVLTTVGGGGAWNLGGAAPVVSDFLRDSKSLKGVCVVLSPFRTGVYVVIFNNGNAAGQVPTAAFSAYEAFAADWRNGVNAAVARSQQAARSRNTGRSIVKGINLMAQILNAANGNATGGGGQVFTSNTYVSNNTMDMSGFWAPLQSAASDPIQ